VIGVRHRQHRDGAVPLCVEQLVIVVGVARVADTVEYRGGVVFLRLVVEDEDDFAAGANPRVVIVIQFRRGNPVTGEHYLARERHLVRKVGGGVRRAKRLDRLSLARNGKGGELPVRSEFDQRNRLQKGIPRRGLQPRLGEFARDPLDRHFRSACQRQPPLQGFRG